MLSFSFYFLHLPPRGKGLGITICLAFEEFEGSSETNNHSSNERTCRAESHTHKDPTKSDGKVKSSQERGERKDEITDFDKNN